MSVSKLESLPNEILIDIFEKYLNGIDILVAFAFQLNRRFDALILQCQRLRFDFIGCHKDDFRLCTGLLPAYMNKIEELSLSEQNTPGQIHAFLSFFPSFASFIRLRTLHFHVNIEAVEEAVLRRALHSLSQTNLHTLSIKVTGAQKVEALSDVTDCIFYLKSLKKLSFVFDTYWLDWNLLRSNSSSIEYLTICAIAWTWSELECIFFYTPRLKYLNIQNSFQMFDTQEPPSKNDMPIMTALHTLIFNTNERAEIIFDMLEPYLLSMLCLKSLEIKVDTGLFNGTVWETFLMTSLPKLTRLNLESNVINLKQADIYSSLESFQTPFWIEKKNFNIILTMHRSDLLFMDEPLNSRQMELFKHKALCWIAPRREISDNLTPMNKITSLQLSTEGSALLQYHYFDNINHLVLLNMNEELFEWIKTHIKASRIKHLDVSHLNKKSDTISLLLSSIQNIISLRIRLGQLANYQYAFLETVNCLKFLDISVTQHRFIREDIVMIAKLFPNVQHLTINTQDLRNIQILHTYLPRLHSLTFENTVSKYLTFYNTYEQQMADYNLRQNTKFLFQRKGAYLTLWTDQATFQKSYWRNIRREHKGCFKIQCSLI